MANRWTAEQQAAIWAEGSNLLVSAAAGSGKTAVLVERIIRKITDPKQPVDIDRLLVVTFTNAAAAEMRERIIAAITKELDANPDNARLARQLVLAASANIMTIHSFCLNVLRTNFNLAGIDPNFRIADTTENELLRIEALDEVMDEMVEEDEFAEPFADLTDAYSSVKNNTALYQLINRIYDFVMSLSHPKQWLLDASERFSAAGETFDQSEWAQILVSAAKEEVRQALVRYDDMLQKAELDDGMESAHLLLLQERQELAALLEADTYSEWFSRLSSFTFGRFPTAPKKAAPRYRDYIKGVREKIKKNTIGSLVAGLFNLTADQQEHVRRALCPQMRCLSQIVSNLIDRFDEKKAVKNILNFNDLEHGAYHLFTDETGAPTELAKSIRGRFDEILIDEYQDTSKLQESIFNAIKQERNLFMVGDLKQSIYRFRNTDPMLFREKKDAFSTSAGALNRKITLSKNFRSRAEVLDGINYIFERIMSPEAGELDYNEEEMLYPGADFPPGEACLPLENELILLDLEDSDDDGGEKPEKAEAEALAAAKKIDDLISGGYQILTKNGYRTISYRDICILLRATKAWAPVFSQVFSQYGIPCYTDTGGGFLQTQEIDTMICLLKIVDNPYQDIPLLAVLRSQIYAFTTNDLAEIRMKDRAAPFFDALRLKAQESDTLGTAAKAVLSDLREFREKSKYMALDALIWDIYMRTGFYDAQGTLPGGLLRQSNLRLLYLRAGEYEKTSFKGLYQFVRFIDEYQSAGGDYDAARTIGEEQNVVRIMSIHKSKGLEFPVVLLCGLGKRFNKRDLNESVLIHPVYGYGPKFVDQQLRVTYPNAFRTAVKSAIERETLSEEMRILYVAMTRAKEKLVLIGSVNDLSARAYDWGLGIGREAKLKPHKVLSAGCYLDWIGMALISHPDCSALRDGIDYDIPLCADGSRWSITVSHSVSSAPDSIEASQEEFDSDSGADGALLKELTERIAYQYPHDNELDLPTKITVSELKSKYSGLDEEHSVYLYPKPRFLQDAAKKTLSGAARGIAYHTVMRRLELSHTGDLDALQRQIEELTEKGYLTRQEADCVDPHILLRFFQSGTGKRMREANQVRREVLFGIHISAAELDTKYSSESKVMLQGVIDCILFEADGMVIIDYKTDHVTDVQEIVDKYQIQLDSYARAAEIIYSAPVKEKVLYLFDTGAEIRL